MTDDIRATQYFLILNVLAFHCGEVLTPERVEQIANEIKIAMREGPMAWAFEVNP